MGWGHVPSQYTQQTFYLQNTAAALPALVLDVLFAEHDRVVVTILPRILSTGVKKGAE